MKKLFYVFGIAAAAGVLFSQAFASVKIESSIGAVTRIAEGQAIEEAVSPGNELKNGDTIVTADESLAVLVYSDGHKTTLREGTQFLVKSSQGDILSTLIKGKAKFVVNKMKAKTKYELVTPAATMCIRGTVFFTEVPDAGPVKTFVESGQIEVIDLASGVTTPLSEGNVAEAKQDGSGVETRTATQEEKKEAAEEWTAPKKIEKGEEKEEKKAEKKAEKKEEKKEAKKEEKKAEKKAEKKEAKAEEKKTDKKTEAKEEKKEAAKPAEVKKEEAKKEPEKPTAQPATTAKTEPAAVKEEPAVVKEEPAVAAAEPAVKPVTEPEIAQPEIATVETPVAPEISIDLDIASLINIDAIVTASVDALNDVKDTVNEQRTEGYTATREAKDVFGNTVIIQQNLLRPTPDSIQFINLTQRGNEIDKLEATLIFSENLPEKMGDFQNFFKDKDMDKMSKETSVILTNSKETLQWKMTPVEKMVDGQLKTEMDLTSFEIKNPVTGVMEKREWFTEGVKAMKDTKTSGVEDDMNTTNEIVVYDKTTGTIPMEKLTVDTYVFDTSNGAKLDKNYFETGSILDLVKNVAGEVVVSVFTNSAATTPRGKLDIVVTPDIFFKTTLVTEIGTNF